MPRILAPGARARPEVNSRLDSVQIGLRPAQMNAGALSSSGVKGIRRSDGESKDATVRMKRECPKK